MDEQAKALAAYLMDRPLILLVGGRARGCTIAERGRRSPTSPLLLRYIRAVDRWRYNGVRGVGL
ncbi:hypothetical protein ACTWPT_26965 [Nonomuraea sp. 3N208]|uniref:hypothetical protein n=1 Tax=Nonomuraea sp. 3N208 TaxID=3457421 RepID=UPI003FD68A4B